MENGNECEGAGNKMHSQATTTAGKVIRCKAAVAYGPGQPMVVEEILVDPPKAMEVRVKILYTSICHSDLSAWRGEVKNYYLMVIYLKSFFTGRAMYIYIYIHTRAYLWY